MPEYVDPTHVVGLPEPATGDDHVPYVDPTNVVELPEPATEPKKKAVTPAASHQESAKSDKQKEK